MMSCNRHYVEPTEALMRQDDKNLPTHKLCCAIALREHMPSKNGEWFQQLLKFSKQVTYFYAFEGTLPSFLFREPHPQILYFKRVLGSGGS